MNPHAFAIDGCVACGILMVLGSFYLLQTGRITLSAAAKENALDVELIKRIRISTTYPALGLFVIGWGFAALGVYFSQADIVSPKPDLPLAVVGDIKGVADPSLATVTVVPDEFGWNHSIGVNSDGHYEKLLPTVKQYRIEVSANGYRPRPWSDILNLDDAVARSTRRELSPKKDITLMKVDPAATPTPAPTPVSATPPPPGTIVPAPSLAPFRAPAAPAASPGSSASPPATGSVRSARSGTGLMATGPLPAKTP
jgi:hypothetical protein